jgi:threonine dehydrogenase-like Zn-dependent dehydrogenase
MSRHADRQALAREFGATDIVEERGDEGVARVKELTGGLGAHSVVEAVGTHDARCRLFAPRGRAGTSDTSAFCMGSCQALRSSSPMLICMAVPHPFAVSCRSS